MKIVVVGSGGVGGYFGAKLAKAGEDVTLVARGAHLKAMRENGICIRSSVDGEWRVDVHAVESLKDEPVADIVLFCVKSFDTEEAAEMIRPVVGSRTGIVSLQNGIDNEEKLARILGKDHVMGGVSYVFSNIVSLGIIAHHQLGRIIFGELNGEISARATEFANACKHADIPVEIAKNIRAILWEKYIFLAALAGTTSATRLPVKFIRDVPEVRKLWQSQVEELLALAIADHSGLDSAVIDRSILLLESLAPTNYSSLYQDLVRGNRLELETLHGHAVRLGKQYGIPTPTLDTVYAILLPYLHGTPL